MNRRFIYYRFGFSDMGLNQTTSVRYFSIFAECDINYFTMKSLILAQDER